MSNFIKVLLLHEVDEHIESIKKSIYEGHRKCLFIVANSKVSFNEKLKWMNPDVVVSDFKITDYSGEEALMLLKKNKPNTPFVFALDNNEESLFTTIPDQADGMLTLDKLAEFPSLISKLLFQPQVK